MSEFPGNTKTGSKIRWRPAWVAVGWAWAIAIVWLSLTPAPPTVDLEQGDKLGHLLGYGALMLWFCLLYARRPVRIAYGVLWVAMGIALEFAQGQLGYRTYEVYDMYANALGVLLGWGAALVIPRATSLLPR